MQGQRGHRERIARVYRLARMDARVGQIALGCLDQGRDERVIPVVRHLHVRLDVRKRTDHAPAPVRDSVRLTAASPSVLISSMRMMARASVELVPHALPPMLVVASSMF